jgi:hypothetical protein
MPQPKSKPSKSSWAAAFGAALKTREQLPPGAGWKTIPEIKDELGVGHVKFYQTLKILRAAGRVEHFAGKIMADNKLVRCIWYRVK